MFKDKNGFTLIELLIVISVIAILAAIVFVALNPLARFQDSRNARRWTDVNSIIEAIELNRIDNGGSYFDELENKSMDLYYQIGGGDSCNETCANPSVILQSACLDLEELIDGGYLPSVPIDPNASGPGEGESDYTTKYYLIKNSAGTITVGSCSEELGSNSSIPEIQVSR